jgi:hypothetical protein
MESLIRWETRNNFNIIIRRESLRSIMQFFDNVLFKILYLENKIRETILSFLTELSC